MVLSAPKGTHTCGMLNSRLQPRCPSGISIAPLRGLPLQAILNTWLQHDSPFHFDRQVSQNTSRGAIKIGLVMVLRMPGHPIRLSTRLLIYTCGNTWRSWGSRSNHRHKTFYSASRVALLLYRRSIRHTERNTRCNETGSPLHGHYLK
jgi:hypothetical protein